MKYNWQQAWWPNFRYNLSGIEPDLILFSDKAGQIDGAMKGMRDMDRAGTLVDLMIAEAIKTSAIEGESLSRPDVASSIKNQLGLNVRPERVRDLASQGMAELQVDLRNRWADPLTEEMIFSWHRMLMKGMRGLVVGSWRTHAEAMQVVSGAIGSSSVLFEAPPSKRVPEEMAVFLRWFNESKGAILYPPVRAAIAHLYFESIHPLEDGNGRIGRALAEKALSQGLGRPVLMSLSSVLEEQRARYYEELEAAQKSGDATAWIRYFVNVTLTAQNAAQRMVDFVIKKARFFDHYRELLAPRPLQVIQRMLEEGADGFRGGMNARKYAVIAKVSKATATRDLQELVRRGVFIPRGAGRSACYDVNLDPSLLP